MSPDVILIDGADELLPYGRNDYEPRRSICFGHVELKITQRKGMLILDDATSYPGLRSKSTRQVIRFRGVGPCRFGLTTTFLYTEVKRGMTAG